MSDSGDTGSGGDTAGAYQSFADTLDQAPSSSQEKVYQPPEYEISSQAELDHLKSERATPQPFNALTPSGFTEQSVHERLEKLRESRIKTIEELLGDADPNDPEVRAFIETLFNILMQIVDLSWGRAPAQIAKEYIGGQLSKILAETDAQPVDMIESKKLTNRFEAVAEAAE